MKMWAVYQIWVREARRAVDGLLQSVQRNPSLRSETGGNFKVLENVLGIEMGDEIKSS